MNLNSSNVLSFLSHLPHLLIFCREHIQIALISEFKKQTETAEQLAILKSTLKAVEEATLSIGQDQNELTAQLTEALSQNKLMKEKLNSLTPLIRENESLLHSYQLSNQEISSLNKEVVSLREENSSLKVQVLGQALDLKEEVKKKVSTPLSN